MSPRQRVLFGKYGTSDGRAGLRVHGQRSLRAPSPAQDDDRRTTALAPDRRHLVVLRADVEAEELAASGPVRIRAADGADAPERPAPARPVRAPHRGAQLPG